MPNGGSDLERTLVWARSMVGRGRRHGREACECCDAAYEAMEYLVSGIRAMAGMADQQDGSLGDLQTWLESGTHRYSRLQGEFPRLPEEE